MSSLRTLSIISLATSLLVACGTSVPTTLAPVEEPTDQPSPPTVQPSPVRPTSEPTEEPPAPEPTPTLLAQQGATLGLTRADAALFFKFLEFAFELNLTPSGEEEFEGTVTDGLATVHILGPEDAVTSISVVIDVPTPPTENQSARTIVYLAAIITVAADDWTEGTQWLNESMNVMGESRVTFDGREAVLLLEPESDRMHVELTVGAVP